MVRQSVWRAIVVSRCGFEAQLVCPHNVWSRQVPDWCDWCGRLGSASSSLEASSHKVSVWSDFGRCSQAAVWSPTSPCHEWSCVVIRLIHRPCWLVASSVASYNKSCSSLILAENKSGLKGNYHKEVSLKAN